MTVQKVNIWDLAVQVSVGLSCGCTHPKSSAFPQLEAAGVGQTVICDRHQEYAVVIRHTRYLADTSERALSLLLQHLFEPGEEFYADTIASEQAPRSSKPRKPAHANRWGAYICEPCSNGEHPGVNHHGLCQCTCDGKHDAKGKLIPRT